MGRVPPLPPHQRWSAERKHPLHSLPSVEDMVKKKCEHGRERYYCKDCGGSGICKHGRQRSICKDCGGSSICEHGRERSRCKDCGGGTAAAAFASTVQCGYNTILVLY